MRLKISYQEKLNQWGMNKGYKMEMDESVNVLDEPLVLCGDNPVTGFFVIVSAIQVMMMLDYILFVLKHQLSF